MKKITILIVLFFASQIFSMPSLAFHVGQTNPFAPENFKGNYYSGYTVGAEAGKWMSEKLLLSASFSYEHFAIDDNHYLGTHDVDLASSFVDGGNTSLINIFILGRQYYPTDKTPIKPYLIGGVGYIRQNYQELSLHTEFDVNVIPQNTINAFGIIAGVGAEFPVADNTTLFVEGTFNIGMADETLVTFPLKLGFRLK